MKLFEKVKNMFTEEVEEEVKVEQIPSKPKKENLPNVVDSFDSVKIEKEEVKKPVFFTDHDFEDMDNKQSRNQNDALKRSDYNSRLNDYSTSNQYGGVNDYNKGNGYNDSYSNDYRRDIPSKTEAYRGNQTNVYNDPYKEKKEERVFKPTPIISPVYGILDKNYHKEDIVSKKDVEYKRKSEVDTVDSVRRKAYGTLEDELENTLFGSNSILFNKKDESNNDNDEFFSELEKESTTDLLDNYNDNELELQDKKIRDLEEITMDIGKELNSLLTKKDNSKVEEKQDDDDLFNLIDTMYEGDE